MKTLVKFGLMLTMVTALFLSSCMGSYYATVQPADPVYDRPASPYADAVWIDGDWTWNGSAYAYNRGHWEHARAGHTYVRGNWEHTNRGYRWHKGYWR